MTERRPCPHPVLRFGSGGFFLMCEACLAYWKAEHIVNGKAEPDYERVDTTLDRQIRITP